MADGLSTLDSMIARLRALPDLPREAAPEVADVVHAELTANIAAGVDPNGTAWPLTQEGERPLQDAGRDLTVRAVGEAIVARLRGVFARHHYGRVRGGVKRQILPTSKLPGTMAVAIERVYGRAFQRVMGGR